MEGLPSDFPAPKTMDVPTNLPAPRTTFVGRARELAQIGQLLEQTGLVTLTGTGGCGKTRLAIEAAAGLLPSYRDGIFFVDLATITNPDLVPSTIALALDVRQESSRPIEELLKDVLQDRETLLVLDNFEQVLEAAPVIAGLLSASPRLRVLVTSRAALHLSGEQEFPVPPLGTPDARDIPRTQELTRYEAIDLFVQRASRVDPNFRITDANSAAVAQICAQLDGLPLAIELAASRVKLLPPASMLKRLERRLALLTGGARDLPARQRTLRDTIGWSYDLLDREEQILFSRLATFVGGWTIEAAEAVANPDSELGVDTLDALGSLMDKSLIRRSDPDTESRFQMLGTIREFGIDKLAEVGDADLVRRRHALYYLELVTAAESGLTARDQGWRNRLESEHDNIRAALSWTIDARATDIGMGIVGALWRFWQMRGHLAEGRRWTDEVLGLPGAAARTATRAKALSASGSLAYWLRDTESVLALYRESLEIYREIRDRRGEAEAAYNLGFAHLLEGDVRAAKDLYETAAQMYRSVGDRLRLAQAVMALGMVAYHEGDLEKSDALTEEARAAFLDAGDLWGISMTAGQLGALALRRGEHERARRAITESLELNDKLGNRLGTSVGIQGLAVLAVRFGRPEAAVRLAGAVHRIREVAGGEAPRDLVGLEDPVDVAKRHLAADRIAALWNEGRAMSFEEALASARLEGSEPDDASVEAAPLSPREGATSNDEETTAAGDEAER
jgi:predicted ATPase